MKKRLEELLDEALHMEPQFQLRGDFKDRVLKAIQKKEKSQQRKLYFWMALGTLVMLGFGFGIMAYFLPATLDSIGGSTGIGDQVVPVAILIGIAVGVIQYLDKKLVKDKFMHV